MSDRMPRMPITTTSSIRVKPSRARVRRDLSFIDPSVWSFRTLVSRYPCMVSKKEPTLPSRSLAAFEKVAEAREEFRRQGVVVVAACGEQLFRLDGGGEETLALDVGDEGIAGAVADEDGFFELGDLGEVVELVAHQPADGQPGVQALADIGERAEGVGESDAAVLVLAMGQIDGDAAAERAAVQQDALGVDALGIDEPIVGSVGGGVAALFARFAFALAVAGVVEDQDGFAEELAEFLHGAAAMAEVAGVAVAVEDGALRAGYGPPPGVDARAVGARKKNVLHVGRRRRLPILAGLG